MEREIRYLCLIISFVCCGSPLYAGWQQWYLKGLKAVSSVATKDGRRGIANSIKSTFSLHAPSCPHELSKIGVDVKGIARNMHFNTPVVCEFPTDNASYGFEKKKDGYHLYIPANDIIPEKKKELEYSIALKLREAQDNRWGRSAFSLLSASWARFFERRADLILVSRLSDGLSSARLFYASHYEKIMQLKTYCGSITLDTLLCTEASNEPNFRPVRAALASRWEGFVRWLQPNLNKPVGEIIEKQGDLLPISVAERMALFKDFERRRRYMPTCLARWVTLVRKSKPLMPEQWRYDLPGNGNSSGAQHRSLEDVSALYD